MNKLQQLEKITAEDRMSLAQAATWDSVAEGICCNKGCDYVATVEPDCEMGWCELCNTESVKSVLVLIGIV